MADQEKTAALLPQPTVRPGTDRSSAGHRQPTTSEPDTLAELARLKDRREALTANLAAVDRRAAELIHQGRERLTMAALAAAYGIGRDRLYPLLERNGFEPVKKRRRRR